MIRFYFDIEMRTKQGFKLCHGNQDEQKGNERRRLQVLIINLFMSERILKSRFSVWYQRESKIDVVLSTVVNHE